jgi:hypothetical protein
MSARRLSTVNSSTFSGLGSGAAAGGAEAEAAGAAALGAGGAAGLVLDALGAGGSDFEQVTAEKARRSVASLRTLGS